MMKNKEGPNIKNARLATTRPLRSLLRELQEQVRLSRKDRLLIVEQALAMLELSYVHLRAKAAMYAVDPIQRLVDTLAPDEEWVTLRYRALNGNKRDVKFEWLVYSQRVDKSAERQARQTGEALAFGFDIQWARIQEARKDLIAPAANRIAGMEEDERLTHRVTATSLSTKLPTMFDARKLNTKYGIFGYVRIFTFMHPEADAFVAEFQRLIQLLPQNGLVIDVRGNGGGNILACERLLQLLTPKEIEPARFQLVNSPLTLALCQLCPNIRPWEKSIRQSVQTGETQSASPPITTKDSCNKIGQKYGGPVVLITDALCYSAADIFAAQFQDHNIGKILGTSHNTGAGGANVWVHSDLCDMVWPLSTHSPVRGLFRRLPYGTEMRVAIRRCLRVGRNAGTPVEDLGVAPDATHHMTRRDLLERNEDLLNEATRILVKGVEKGARRGEILEGKKRRKGRLQHRYRQLSRIRAQDWTISSRMYSGPSLSDLNANSL
jgi:hypothetical protein